MLVTPSQNVDLPTIRRGDTGEAVVLCQNLLTYHGFVTTADGIFGTNTESQVKAFQTHCAIGVDGIVGDVTWDHLCQPYDVLPPQPLPPLLAHAQSLGHQIWGEPYRMWYFGIRSPQRVANAFDDLLGAAWVCEEGLWNLAYWPGTTDPGTYWLEHPSRVEGTAILVEGQYLDTWMLGPHGDPPYEALVQWGGTVKVYRDDNRDNILDMDPDTIMEGWFGIQLHRSTASGESTEVNKWSAGCQVHAKSAGFDEMMRLAHVQLDWTGRDTYSYTLMDQWW